MYDHQPAAPTAGSRGGFTLIEVLVVVGIIAVISSLLLTAVFRSRKTANVIRLKSDLSLIETALEAYKNDCKDYPRFTDIATFQATYGTAGSGAWLDKQPDRGARLLCRALLGPGPADLAGAAVAKPGDDGADGNGFRLTRNLVMNGTTPVGLAGRVYGPYIQADKFKVEYDTTGTTFPNFQDAKLLDFDGNPILYYPARFGGVNVSVPKGFVYEVNPLTTAANPAPQPLYNSFDDESDTTPSANGRAFLPPADMQYILGDRTHQGQIVAPETAVTTQPFLLWAANPNSPYGTGAYGLQADGKCDAVCNFDVPADLHK